MKSRNIFLIVLLIVGIVVHTRCGTDSDNSTYQSSSQISKWYEGGTLHEAKVSEWKTASYNNKLATCADFAANADKNVTMEVLKYRAEQIQACITEATRDLETTNNEDVVTIATLCALELGYLK